MKKESIKYGVSFRITTLLIFNAFFLFLSGALICQNIDTNVGSKYKIVAVSTQSNIISQSNFVEIINPLNLYVPNAFTPNNDGLNDLFSVYGEGIKSLDISIFDRWGKKVYSSVNFEAWDGKINGETCQSGVYVYKIEAIGHDKRYIQKSGTVSLML